MASSFDYLKPPQGKGMVQDKGLLSIALDRLEKESVVLQKRVEDLAQRLAAAIAPVPQASEPDEPDKRPGPSSHLVERVEESLARISRASRQVEDLGNLVEL